MNTQSTYRDILDPSEHFSEAVAHMSYSELQVAKDIIETILREKEEDAFNTVVSKCSGRYGITYCTDCDVLQECRSIKELERNTGLSAGEIFYK